MTKHLRLIMLSLLAMICMGGYSQSEEDFTKKTWSNPYLFEHYKIVGEQGGNGHKNLIPLQNDNSKDIRCYSDNKLTITSTQGKMKKIVFVLSAQGKKECGEPTVDNGTITRNPKSGTISEVIWENPSGSASVTFTVGASNNWGTNKSKTSGQLCFNKIIITDLVSIEDNRQDAGIQFAKDSYTADIAKGTFNGAELVKPEGINKVIYTISPESEGVSIAEDGTVTYPAVEATYTVTAKFAGNDTYKPATATYTLNVVDPNAVVFEADKDKGTTKGQEADEMSKNGVTIQSTSAALGNGSNYRFYGGSTNTFSVKRGFITKIVFEGNNTGDKYLLTYVGLQDKDNGVFNAENSKATWEGEAKSVVFKTTAQARATKITVTVKLPVAKDYTLDEEDVNVIEDYDNANVTLKRTFYHDNAWNTLCLPFDVDANKVATAFAGAEIREIDPYKCTANTIQFVPATEIKAGVPYIIKWNENVAEAKPFEETFEGVMLVAEPKPVTINKNDIKFTGFYNKTTADNLGESVAAIGAENKLFKVTSGEMKGFRAAFVLKSNTPASVIKLVIDGTATGIEDLVIDGVKANGRVYNLNGQYVGNSLNGLQPGLYIQNGKKIVVK